MSENEGFSFMKRTLSSDSVDDNDDVGNRPNDKSSHSISEAGLKMETTTSTGYSNSYGRGYMDVKKCVLFGIFLSTMAIQTNIPFSTIQAVDAFQNPTPKVNGNVNGKVQTKSHAAVRSQLFRHHLGSGISDQDDRQGISRQRSRRLGRVFPPMNSMPFRRKKSFGNTLSKRIKSPISSISSSSSTALNMVFTTSSSLIEKISTKILLDDLIDESVRTSARNPVMMQFDPSSGWIWRRWKGTVFSETWRAFMTNIFYASIIYMFFSLNHRESLMQALSGFNILWGQLLSVTTFTLTFFLNQSYSLWRSCYGYSRRLQGRLNDLNMTLAAHAARSEPNLRQKPKEEDADDDRTTKKKERNTFHNMFVNGEKSKSDSAMDDNADEDCTSNSSNNINEGELSLYTEGSRQVLELMARYTRVFNLLTYASFTGSHRPLLTPQGMRRMVDRGIITETERQVLSNAELPVTQRHNIILLWIIRLFLDARKAGHIEGSDGFEQQFLEKVHVIRAQYGAIGDELAGRMPLAYAHIVQVLVDVILWMYPFMAFSQGMTPFLGIIGTGLLTMTYQGLFDLAKQFLDPYDNESYGKGEDPLCIDTLIAESNAGSVRWMNGLAEKPFALQKIDDGDMQDYQLPLRGWTVEETFQREEEESMRLIQEEAERAAAAAMAKEQESIEAPEVIMASSSSSIQETEFEETSPVDDDELIDEELCSVDEDEDLTMEEALEKMDECTEKVP